LIFGDRLPYYIAESVSPHSCKNVREKYIFLFFLNQTPQHSLGRTSEIHKSPFFFAKIEASAQEFFKVSYVRDRSLFMGGGPFFPSDLGVG